MTQKGLHPSVVEFKKFVNQNPKIIDEVRTGKMTLQELYEDWYLLGEDDTRWDTFRSEHKSSKNSPNTGVDWLSNVLGSVKKMEPEQIQSHIGQLSQALGAIQGVIAQFQGGAGQKSVNTNANAQKPNRPFQFRKD